MALSRATTLDGLFLLEFNVAVVRAHEKVKTFYAALEVCGFVLLMVRVLNILFLVFFSCFQ